MQRTSINIALLSITSVLLSACNVVDVATWTEEVRIHDGTTITVERTVRAHHAGFPNSSRGSDIDYDLTYRPLGVHWHGTPPGNLVSFEIFDGVPYLVVYDDHRLLCEEKGAGQYKAKFLMWENHQWTQIDQSRYPTNEGLKNLYTHYWGFSTEDDATGFVSWSKKATRDGFDPANPYTIRNWYETFHRVCTG